jgi:copper chaperone CopZ
MKKLLFFLFITLSTSLFAQKPVLVTIQTNALCGDCKERIETALNQTKGVVYAELNMETKVAKVPVSVWFSKAHYDAGNPPVFKFDIFIDRESLGSVTVPESTPLYDVIFTQVLTLAITQSWSPLKDAVVHPLN